MGLIGFLGTLEGFLIRFQRILPRLRGSWGRLWFCSQVLPWSTLAGFGVMSVRATANLKPKTPKPKPPNSSVLLSGSVFGARNIGEAQRERPPCTTKTLFSITVALGVFLLCLVSFYFCIVL